MEWTLPGKSTSLFLDRQFVLVVDLRRVSLTDVDVDIRTADLLDDQPALSDPVPVRIDLNEFAPRTVDGFALDRIVWTCSPRGRWIAASCGALVDLSGADATSTKLPGGVIAFLGDGDHLVLRETSERLALKRVRINQLAPPFWDHLRRKTFRRVVIMDCRNQQVVARSRWLDFLRLRMTCDQSGLVADQIFSGLLWSL